MTRNRRQFIRGRWIAQNAKLPSPQGDSEIASILVQTRPDRLAAAEAAIKEIEGAEIFQRDARGKLVVVVEAIGRDPVGEILTRISLLRDVITATLVYHAVDAACAQPTEDTAAGIPASPAVAIFSKWRPPPWRQPRAACLRPPAPPISSPNGRLRCSTGTRRRAASAVPAAASWWGARTGAWWQPTA